MVKFIMYGPMILLLGWLLWVGFDQLGLQVAFGAIALTFLPKVRQAIYKPELVKQKAKAALWSPVVFVVLLLLVEVMTGTGVWEAADWYFLLAIFLWSCGGAFIYGIPTSLISEWATAGVSKFRGGLAFVIHLAFALLSYLFLGGFAFFAVLVAILFFTLDELFRKREKHIHKAQVQLKEL